MFRPLFLIGFLALGCGTFGEVSKAPPPAVKPRAVEPQPQPEVVAPVAAPPGAEEPPTAEDAWTIDEVSVFMMPPMPNTMTPELVGLRSASHEGFDRVVLELRGQVPGYHVAYIDRPARDCGAGNPLQIEGDALLLVQLTPANAHTEAGASTAPKELKPGLTNVREVERSCDFEAVVAYVVGVASPNPYRVFTLTGPTRLVIDVRQQRR